MNRDAVVRSDGSGENVMVAVVIEAEEARLGLEAEKLQSLGSDDEVIEAAVMGSDCIVIDGLLGQGVPMSVVGGEIEARAGGMQELTVELGMVRNRNMALWLNWNCRWW
ncbi:hypothetical protein M0R45_034642 [Rubus argutus]|uniref:Uncharacterized protein n=1 Tax=Rubus argutus TaxID=59490 RepID=A0AAW1VW56_RUBAR